MSESLRELLSLMATQAQELENLRMRVLVLEEQMASLPLPEDEDQPSTYMDGTPVL